MNKKIIVASLGAAFALTPFLGAVNSFAVAPPSITINNRAEELYVTTGTKSNTTGNVTYDATTNTLTLNNFNGTNVEIDNLESITVKLEGENTLALSDNTDVRRKSLYANEAKLFITGSGSLSVDIDSNDVNVIIGSTQDIVIDGPTLSLKASDQGANTCIGSSEGNVDIKSGVLNLGCGHNIIANTTTIDGGTIESIAPFGEMTTNKKLVINDGTITIKRGSSFPKIMSSLAAEESIIINGGSVVIDGLQDGKPTSEGIGVARDSENRNGFFEMNGGILSIKNVYYGVHFNYTGDESSAKFTGGTATIDADKNIVLFNYETEQDHTDDIIVIKEGMYTSPKNMMVSKTDLSNNTVGYILTANGEPVMKAIISDMAINDSSIVANTDAKTPSTTIGAPDTGLFTGKASVIATAIVLPIVAMTMLLGLVVAGTARRISVKRRFNK